MPQTKRISQIPSIDRPREKLVRKGVAALSDFELLTVLIGSGNAGADVTYIAKQIQRLLRRGPGHVTYESLTAIRGVHTATAGKILASLELAQRHLVRGVEPLRSQHDILARLDDIRGRKQEYLVCMSLDGGHRLIAQRTITIGTLDSVLLHPREIFAEAITDRAASIIVGHNHPSGVVHPSSQDVALTQELVASGQLLGIELRDHIIVSKTEHFSYRQHHML